MSPKMYVMTPQLLKRFESQYGPQVCEVCGKPLKAEDQVISRLKGHISHNGRCQRLHKKCYESLFLEV